jgi:leader peptidase (prepilin peptidase)/N-methyltransferase
LEIAAASAAAGLSFALLAPPAALFAALLAPLAILIAAVDLDRFIIPDSANVAVFILGLALVLTEALPQERAGAFGEALMRAIVAGGVLLLLRVGYRRLTEIDGLGLGDVKLAAAGAPWLQWSSLPFAMVLAAVAAVLAVGMGSLARGERLHRQLQLPFGAFLAPAIWIVFVLERLGLFAQ